MKSGRCTISDIAREVGVSTTTVSRYINGKFNYMSEDTRKLIRIAIERNGYRPNLVARGMKTDRSYLIGVVLPQVTPKVSSHSIRGIIAACAGQTYVPLFSSIENGQFSEKAAIQSLLDHHVDGIISYTGLSTPQYRAVQQSGTPVVLADRFPKTEDMTVVTLDYYQVMQRAMLHLYLSGYRRVALLVDPITISRSSTTRLRIQSFNEFSRPDLVKDIFYVSEQRTEELAAQLHSYVSQDSSPKAVFALSMTMFENLHYHVLLADYKLPDDLGLLGYSLKDDTFYSSRNVTSLQLPIMAMAKKSVDALIQKITQPQLAPPSYTEIPIELVIGRSTLLSR